MTDREIITGYRENVIAIHSIRECIAWNTRHGLPVLTMPELIHQLTADVIRFEDVLHTIPDRRTRNILRCRFALGMTERQTADYMQLSHGTVNRIVTDTLHAMS